MAKEGDTENLKKLDGIWNFLDGVKSTSNYQLISNHQDESRDMERGYGHGEKPEDYLLNFEKYIKENLNEIEALQMICSRPKELDRKSLRELRIILDQHGFNTNSLNAAGKMPKTKTSQRILFRTFARWHWEIP